MTFCWSDTRLKWFAKIVFAQMSLAQVSQTHNQRRRQKAVDGTIDAMLQNWPDSRSVAYPGLRDEKTVHCIWQKSLNIRRSLFFMVAVELVAVLISYSSVWVAVLAVADDTVAIVSESLCLRSLFFSRCFVSRGLTRTRLHLGETDWKNIVWLRNGSSFKIVLLFMEHPVWTSMPSFSENLKAGLIPWS